jgi:hypothetical protein
MRSWRCLAASAALCVRTFDHLRKPVVFSGNNKHALSEFWIARVVGLFPCLFCAGCAVRRILKIVVSRLVCRQSARVRSLNRFRKRRKMRGRRPQRSYLAGLGGPAAVAARCLRFLVNCEMSRTIRVASLVDVRHMQSRSPSRFADQFPLPFLDLLHQKFVI